MRSKKVLERINEVVLRYKRKLLSKKEYELLKEVLEDDK